MRNRNSPTPTTPMNSRALSTIFITPVIPLCPLGVLASVSEDYIKENKIIGWPHPHFPSDHQSLLVEFETVAGAPGYTFGPGSNHLTR